jgi:hypothetical protein
MNKDRGGLMIKLSNEHPTIIRVDGREIKVYLGHNSDGSPRARFVADPDVEIQGPHRIKKGIYDKEHLKGNI